MSYYDSVDETYKSVPLPAYAIGKSAIIEDRRICIQLMHPVPQSFAGRLSINLYFGAPGKGMRMALILPLGTAVYRSEPPLRSGQAGLVDLQGHRLTRLVKYKVVKDTFVFEVPKDDLNGYVPWIGLTHFASPEMTDKRVAFGGECIASEFYKSDELKDRRIILPGHP